jgi:hypothetical protein
MPGIDRKVWLGMTQDPDRNPKDSYVYWLGPVVSCLCVLLVIQTECRLHCLSFTVRTQGNMIFNEDWLVFIVQYKILMQLNCLPGHLRD